ncbi:MAG: leucine-rich repeat protein [Prevotella sp.]|nr:leucine-rich repeat protein [Prevotella sp.]
MKNKTVLKLTSAVLFLAMLPGTARAQTDRVVVDGVVYTFQPFGPGGDFAVTGIDYETLPYDGVITIKDGLVLEAFPGEFRPYPVTSILDNAFIDDDALKGVIFEDGIQSIGSNAFKGCSGITSLTLPTSLLRVGWGAFACGDNLRWIDARNVGEQWKDEYDGYDGLGEIGVPLFTLLYMPSWCSSGGTNVVLTDPGTQEPSCQDFYFDSEMDYNVPWGFTAEKVRTTRKLPMDKSAYTICLPYDLNIPQNAKAYAMMETEDPTENKVIFSQVLGTLDKGMPYLMVADADVSLDSDVPSQILSTEEAQTSTATVAGVTINGTYATISNTDAAVMKAYGLKDGNIWWVVSTKNPSFYIPPFRAFLTGEALQSNSFSFAFSDDIDAIRLLTDGTAAIDNDVWYTLQGVQLPSQPHTPGVYVHHGRKYVVK